MEADNVRNLAVTKPFDTLACLRVPQLDLPVIATGQEPSTIVGEGQVFDSFHMTMECPEAIAMRIDVPQLCKHTTRQK